VHVTFAAWPRSSAAGNFRARAAASSSMTTSASSRCHPIVLLSSPSSFSAGTPDMISAAAHPRVPRPINQKETLDIGGETLCHRSRLRVRRRPRLQRPRIHEPAHPAPPPAKRPPAWPRAARLALKLAPGRALRAAAQARATGEHRACQPE
jgi:hypothetical protein